VTRKTGIGDLVANGEPEGRHRIRLCGYRHRRRLSSGENDMVRTTACCPRACFGANADCAMRDTPCRKDSDGWSSAGRDHCKNACLRVRLSTYVSIHGSRRDASTTSCAVWPPPVTLTGDSFRAVQRRRDSSMDIAECASRRAILIGQIDPIMREGECATRGSFFAKTGGYIGHTLVAFHDLGGRGGADRTRSSCDTPAPAEPPCIPFVGPLTGVRRGR